MKIDVKSSNLKSIDYDEKEQKLIVEFIGGSKYQYDKISPQLYKNFIEAESKGQFFHKYIKLQYIGTKIEDKHRCISCVYYLENFCAFLDKTTNNNSSCEHHEFIVQKSQ